MSTHFVQVLVDWVDFLDAVSLNHQQGALVLCSRPAMELFACCMSGFVGALPPEAFKGSDQINAAFLLYFTPLDIGYSDCPHLNKGSGSLFLCMTTLDEFRMGAL